LPTEIIGKSNSLDFITPRSNARLRAITPRPYTKENGNKSSRNDFIEADLQQKYTFDFNLIFMIFYYFGIKKINGETIMILPKPTGHKYLKHDSFITFKKQNYKQMKISIAIACFFTGILSVTAQIKIDQKLNLKLQELVKGFQGDVGIYVQNLKTGKVAQINADTIFPTASMIKVPIMCGVFDKIEKGELKYDENLVYRDSLLYAGEDILGSFKDGEKIKLGKVQMLSITTSDNTASLWLQKFVGGENINKWLEANGFSSTRMNSRTAGRQADQRKYGWGQTTPREMATLVRMIYQGTAVSPAASERMYRNMTRIYWDWQALSQIPPYIQAASKQGFVSKARSEVVLVNAPHGDYVFCIATKNQKDTSFTADNEGYRMIRSLSKLLWNYFEPKSDWKPAAGVEKYTE
jgi:beta-lactamase class A